MHGGERRGGSGAVTKDRRLRQNNGSCHHPYPRVVTREVSQVSKNNQCTRREPSVPCGLKVVSLPEPSFRTSTVSTSLPVELPVEGRERGAVSPRS